MWVHALDTPLEPQARTRLGHERCGTSVSNEFDDADHLAERLARLYEAHQARVFAVAVRITGDRSEAADITQEVFITVWKRLPTLQNDADAGAWVYRVAVNTALNGLRRAKRRLRRIALLGDTSDASDAGDTTIASLARGAHDAFATPTPIRRLAIDEAITILPDRTRAVFVLHDIEGFDSQEIASMLTMAPSTVRVQLARARARLRERLSR